MGRENNLLGRLLVRAGIVDEGALAKALDEQKKQSQLLATTIIRLKLAKEEDVFNILGQQIGVPYINLKQVKIEPKAIRKVPAKFALNYKLIPIRLSDNILEVALADPLDVQALDDLKLLLGLDAKPYLASEDSIMEAIRANYGVGAETVAGLVTEEKKEEKEKTVKVKPKVEGEEAAEDSSIINFVNQIISQAIKDRATDVHIEPFEDEIIVRYRIDGVLHKVPLPPGMRKFQSAIISRVKIMSNLNIAEKRLPQDGRIKFTDEGGEDYDLRVSILPTPNGEGVCIRILSKSMLLDLPELGLLPDNQKILEKMIKKPNGIILVTGPTGSGKTTTLSACLQKINTPDRKIITVEDPVEYRIKGIIQIQVHTKIGLTFAQGLRSILRHDPDIILIGEIRDYETAEIAIRSSLTGHLVFSTLHTNDAAGGVTRLLDMGVEPFLIASTVDCIIAQRLVRVICKKCKYPVKPSPEVLRTFGLEEKVDKDFVIYEGKGCEDCKHTKYKGRTAIYEFLVVNDKIRELILKRASASEIKHLAISCGMRTLKMEGWERVKMGVTTAEEVLRVSSGDIEVG
jgi:type II secretion system protein E